MLLIEWFACISGVATTYATHLPSGETCGSLTRCIAIMSSNWIARFCVCAEVGIHKNQPENTIQIMCLAKRIERPPPRYSSLCSSLQNDVTAVMPSATHARTNVTGRVRALLKPVYNSLRKRELACKARSLSTVCISPLRSRSITFSRKLRWVSLCSSSS